MMNTSSVLDKIIADKCKEVAQRKSNMPIAKLEATEFFKRPCFSLKNALQNSKTGIIAEYKRRSPSKAIINQESTVRDVAKGYSDAGACGMSVLTDEKYFGGTLDDLTQARAAVQLPLLRKEFVIDEYQLVEAKAYGADVVLLIAAALSKEVVKILSETANNLGLEVLLEIHNEEELQQSPVSGIDMIGVNNRNLKTFDVTLEISKTLARHIPDTVVKVSESGISSIEAVKTLQAHGYRGFL
ncbi:MAG: indole-3-glycerol phosphate synthase TrpC, partial [Bacteroidota bacterium]